MAVYTALSDDEVTGFIQPLDLGALFSVSGVASGIENTNYFVETATGSYVLTLFERLTADELPFYLHLMKHLAARGIPVPDPVANSAGDILHEIEDKPAVIVNRLPGQSVVAPSPAQCRAVGEVLARMHVAGQDYSRHQPNPRGLDWWRRRAGGPRVSLGRAANAAGQRDGIPGAGCGVSRIRPTPSWPRAW